MKQILITDALYDKFKAIADEHDELIETAACLYLEQSLIQMG